MPAVSLVYNGMQVGKSHGSREGISHPLFSCAVLVTFFWGCGGGSKEVNVEIHQAERANDGKQVETPCHRYSRLTK